MAMWKTTGTYNQYHEYYVWLKYDASYDETTNQTTVSIHGWDMAWNYMVDQYYLTEGTFTISATDNPASSDTYGVWYGQKRNPGQDGASGGEAKTIVIQHGRGTNKNITIAWSGYGQVGGKYKATWTDSTTVQTGTATEYHLSISQTNCSVVVTLNDTEELASGATVYYNDRLKISYSAKIGYSIESALLNNQTITNGITHAVSGNVSVVVVATVISFTLTINQGEGTIITVNRTSSPKASASLGLLSNGDALYYSDILNITFKAEFGYDLLTHTINGEPASDQDYAVLQDVIVAATAEQTGLVYIDNGSGWEAYEIWIDNGTSWDLYIPYIDDGVAWQQYS